MSTATQTSAPSESIPLTHGVLPSWAPGLVLAVATALGLLAGVLGISVALSAMLGVLVFLVALPLWSLSVENSRAAVDRLVTAVIWSAFALACVPLVWLMATVITRGGPALDGAFLMSSMRNVVNVGGGIHHALIGTLLVTLGTCVISVPIGIFTAIYLVEYGKGKRLARTVTFLVDVMTGIPSIVAGLFALAVFMLIFGPAIRIGIMGSVALSLLMIPTVVRATEEMLRLVPDDLREASYALGVPKWRTIVKVVLPTAFGGIVTGVVLGISRVIGETAPLLVTAGAADSDNFNLFSDRMMTLPVYILEQYRSPGTLPFGETGDPPGYARAWAAALMLVIIVLVLNLIARLIGKIFAPAKSR